jgi:FKBP-type peptidyl-prolyl cis-trans isomerase FklB
MKKGVLAAIILVLVLSGFALIFYTKEDAADAPLPAAKSKIAPHFPLPVEPGPDRKALKPKEKMKPKSPALAGTPLTLGQEAAEAARLEGIAAARAVFEQALAANDPVAVASRDFLATNGQREGVTTTASGLQYEVMTPGTGPLPAATDMVKVHYHGTLPDGTVFDSSIERGEPVTFPLSAVIAGWTEGLQLMPTGSKSKLTIPSWLAYGAGGAGEKIPAHSALVFEVEFFAIKGN